MENLSMTSGTCSLSARFHSLMRQRFISNKMNSRLSMPVAVTVLDVGTLKVTDQKSTLSGQTRVESQTSHRL